MVHEPASHFLEVTSMSDSMSMEEKNTALGDTGTCMLPGTTICPIRNWETVEGQ